MERLLDRLYARYDSRYIVGALLVVLAELTLLVGPIAAFFPSRYEGLSVAQYFTLLVAVEAAGLIICGGGLFAVRRNFRDLLAWSRTGRDELVNSARAGAFEGPRRAGLTAMAISALLAAFPVALLATPQHHTTTLDWIELSIGALMAVVLGGLNAWFTLEVLLRPARAALGGAPPEAHRGSLLVRLALVVPATTWIAGVAVGYLATTRAKAGAGHLLVVYGIAFAGAGVCLILLVPLFTGGVVSPIRDLTRATRAVGAGRLDTRVPVTSTDELGSLARSFNEMLRDLQSTRTRIVTAADTARRKVERDLHDGAQQRLVLLKLKLGMLAADPARPELLDEICGDLDLALEDLRNLARGIYPPLLESDGLPAALGDAVRHAAVPARLECDGAGRYAAEVEAAVYFCCMEALQNAAKHAGAVAQATIRLTQTDGILRFEVADDGRGFDPASASRSAGLQNMIDRIGALGGTLTIDSRRGAGTSVRGVVPVG